MRLLLIGCLALALASCHKASEPAATPGSAAVPEAPGKGVDRSHKGQAAPATGFHDLNGKTTSLKAFAGKPTLVNLWASWCAPCVKELPSLDRLAQSTNGKLNVVAISQDMATHPSVVAFLKAHKIATLGSYHDPKMALSGALNAQVLPTAILYDANGK